MKATPRRVWLTAAGLGALMLGVQWRRLSEPEAPALDPAAAALWASEFTDTDSHVLPLQRFKGKPLLVNFWATWCAPCVLELPELNHLAEQWRPKGAQVLGIAVDRPEAVHPFLEKTKLLFPVVLGGSSGLALARAMGNVAGGLPFSVLTGADGRVLAVKLGASTQADLQVWSSLAGLA